MSDIYRQKLEGYKDNLVLVRWLSLSVMVLTIASVLLVVGLFCRGQTVKAEYFAATDDGRLIKMSPLSEPEYTDSTIVQWASKVINTTFDYHYSNINNHFRKVGRQYFTPNAIDSLVNHMQESGTWKKILDDTIFVSNILISRPVIDRVYLVNNIVHWDLRAPARIVYANGYQTQEGKKMMSDHVYMVNMTIRKVSLLSSEHGIRVSHISVGRGDER